MCCGRQRLFRSAWDRHHIEQVVPETLDVATQAGFWRTGAILDMIVTTCSRKWPQRWRWSRRPQSMPSIWQARQEVIGCRDPDDAVVGHQDSGT
jgi:hypothetical protein